MGKRGEGWFVLQMVLFAVILLTPRIPPVLLPTWARGLGLIFLAAGGVLGTWGMIALGRNLTPFPRPIDGGSLVTAGPYRFVRHPIYAGLILGTLGWALLRSNLLGVLLDVVLFLFFDLKSRREERWLAESYAGYGAYRRQVRKLIPFVY
ncbi:MAG: Isoprenylcysteine carboxyl methyltransferase (ICMT) family protein [Chloroflexi bacterium ADurb.Bin325]|nr:MAG: Isoprenylcysteine carboxyl methyltransferase (ICMT) family protein [Chloroflexi bacterium ADurb.Bin325]